MKKLLALALCVLPVKSLMAFEFKGLTGDPAAVSALVEIPKAQIAPLLPKGLILMEQGIASAGNHPVILFMGRQKNLKAAGTSVTFPSYLESIVAIPYVGFEGKADQTPRIHLAQLFLDSFLAIKAGQYFYGMPKEKAVIQWKDGTFRVRKRFEKEPRLEAKLSDPSAFDKKTFDDNLSIVASLYAQPLVQARRGKFVCALADWHFSEARARPVSAQVTVHFSKGAGSAPLRFAAPGLDVSPFGAFYFQTHWELEAAHPCDH